MSRRERQVMDILHRRGQATVSEVMNDLADPPTYSAVRSILRILAGKGLVTHREDGPRYVYAPTANPDRARDVAATTRERQLVAIATAHRRGERELVDALARDHLVDHPDNVLVAWIADASHHSRKEGP